MDVKATKDGKIAACGECSFCVLVDPPDNVKEAVSDYVARVYNVMNADDS